MNRHTAPAAVVHGHPAHVVAAHTGEVSRAVCRGKTRPQMPRPRSVRVYIAFRNRGPKIEQQQLARRVIWPSGIRELGFTLVRPASGSTTGQATPLFCHRAGGISRRSRPRWWPLVECAGRHVLNSLTSKAVIPPAVPSSTAGFGGTVSARPRPRPVPSVPSLKLWGYSLACGLRAAVAHRPETRGRTRPVKRWLIGDAQDNTSFAEALRLSE